MSVHKIQKTHRERHQPQIRKHLGLLEKKKDYVERARDFNEKKQTLKLLRKRALNKNPDEFYHHMINAQVENGRHLDKEKEEEDTPEQLRLMRTQDLKYITTKRTQELKKIEKIQAELHLFSVDHSVKNTHKFFKDNSEKKSKSKQHEEVKELDLDEADFYSLMESSKKKRELYVELSKRIHRENELAVVQQKLETRRHLESGKHQLKPKKIRKGGKDRAPVYVWKYERKK